MSGAEQTRKSWRYPGDKLNRNLLGHAGRGLASDGRARAARGPAAPSHSQIIQLLITE